MRIRMQLILVGAVLLPLASPCVADGKEDGSSVTIRPDYSYKEIYDVYEKLRKGNQPQFITTDQWTEQGKSKASVAEATLRQ